MSIFNFDKYQLLKNRDNHNCFGCSPKNSTGLQMKFYIDKDALYSPVTVPKHLCGWDNLVHGGILSTIIDEIMSWSAIFLAKKIILTKSMTVTYVKPVNIGMKIIAKGEIHRKINDREIEMSGVVLDEEGNLYVKATGIFALFEPEALRKMKILDEQIIKDFEEIIKENITN